MGFIPFVLQAYSQQIVADTGAPTIKIPEGVYGDIQIRLSGTGGSGTVVLNTDPTLITRLKLKKGSQYLVDATGTQLRALARNKNGCIPTVTVATSAYSELVVPVYFGRYARDKSGLFIAGQNCQIELTYGTLIATTAFATGTVCITVFGSQWVGALPPEYKGAMGCMEVEDKATGTLRAIWDLHTGRKTFGFLIEVVTITTVRQVRIQNSDSKPVLAESEWRDILNSDNYEQNKETAETTLAVWKFYNEVGALEELLDLSILRNPQLVMERGATTTVTCMNQLDLFT